MKGFDSNNLITELFNDATKYGPDIKKYRSLKYWLEEGIKDKQYDYRIYVEKLFCHLYKFFIQGKVVSIVEFKLNIVDSVMLLCQKQVDSYISQRKRKLEKQKSPNNYYDLLTDINEQNIEKDVNIIREAYIKSIRDVLSKIVEDTFTSLYISSYFNEKYLIKNLFIDIRNYRNNVSNYKSIEYWMKKINTKYNEQIYLLILTSIFETIYKYVSQKNGLTLENLKQKTMEEALLLSKERINNYLIGYRNQLVDAHYETQEEINRDILEMGVFWTLEYRRVIQMVLNETLNDEKEFFVAYQLYKSRN